MIVGIRGVVKRFGSVTAVSAVELTVGDGELFTLLGPSGCGKTTLLRLVAGFYQPDAGTIRFGERVVNGLPPYERGIGMVFQNYALWPHMTVAENVAFGLHRRRVPRAEVARRVEQALDLVGLEGYGGRRPAQLSGGQQQRVAVARALVAAPPLVLADEPTGNLDTSTSDQVFDLLRHVNRTRGVAFLIVTHDPRLSARCERVIELVDGRIVPNG